MRKTILLVLLVLVLGLLPVDGQADTRWYSNRALWEAAVASLADVNLATQVQDGGTLSAHTSLNLPNTGTVSFNLPLYGYQVGISWDGWSGGNTPRILFNDAVAVSATFSAPQKAFGLEMKPLVMSVRSMTLSTGSGLNEYLQQDVNGHDGAKFFGWVVGKNDVGYTSMTLSTVVSAPYFGFGRMVQGTVPAPVPLPGSVWLLLRE